MLHKILTKLRFSIMSKVAFVAAAIALPVAMAGGVASASGYYCTEGSNGDGYCLNATGPQNTSNIYSCDDHFGGGCSTEIETPNWDFLAAGGGYSELANDNWSGCIGDYGNNSGRADAALDECPTQGNAGWGTKFVYEYCSNGIGAGYYFFNYHWSDWLGPQSNGANQKEYLNKPSGWCFSYIGGL